MPNSSIVLFETVIASSLSDPYYTQATFSEVQKSKVKRVCLIQHNQHFVCMQLAQLYEKCNIQPLLAYFGLQDTNNSLISPLNYLPILIPIRQVLRKKLNQFRLFNIALNLISLFKEWYYFIEIENSHRSKAIFSVIRTSKLNCVELECLDSNFLPLQNWTYILPGFIAGLCSSMNFNSLHFMFGINVPLIFFPN